MEKIRLQILIKHLVNSPIYSRFYKIHINNDLVIRIMPNLKTQKKLTKPVREFLNNSYQQLRYDILNQGLYNEEYKDMQIITESMKCYLRCSSI